MQDLPYNELSNNLEKKLLLILKGFSEFVTDAYYLY